MARASMVGGPQTDYCPDCQTVTTTDILDNFQGLCPHCWLKRAHEMIGEKGLEMRMRE